MAVYKITLCLRDGRETCDYLKLGEQFLKMVVGCCFLNDGQGPRVSWSDLRASTYRGWVARHHGCLRGFYGSGGVRSQAPKQNSQMGPSWAQQGPKWGPNGAQMGANLAQLGPIWNAAWAGKVDNTIYLDELFCRNISDGISSGILWSFKTLP